MLWIFWQMWRVALYRPSHSTALSTTSISRREEPAAETPYCITKALINAAEGKIDEALLFCGSNAYRCEKIETVPEVMAALCGE